MKKTFDTEKFKKARVDAGLTVAELARRLHCNHTDVHRYENGESYPRPKRLKELVSILGTTILDDPVVANPLSAIGRFRPDVQRLIASFVALPYHEQCQFLVYCSAVVEFGQLADADFGGRLAEQLAKLIPQPQEQSG